MSEKSKRCSIMRELWQLCSMRLDQMAPEEGINKTSCRDQHHCEWAEKLWHDPVKQIRSIHTLRRPVWNTPLMTPVLPPLSFEELSCKAGPRSDTTLFPKQPTSRKWGCPKLPASPTGRSRSARVLLRSASHSSTASSSWKISVICKSVQTELVGPICASNLLTRFASSNSALMKT